VSSDTRSKSPDADPNDPDATRQAEPSTVPPIALDDDFDPEGEEATVMARIPDELIAGSLRKEPTAGLRQTFGRDPAPARQAIPTDAEGDALLDMIFDDSHAAAPPPAKPAATPPALPVRPAPPPAPRAAPPPPPRAATPPPAPAAPAMDNNVDEPLSRGDEIDAGALLDDAEPDAAPAEALRVHEAEAEAAAAETTFDKEAPTMDLDPGELAREAERAESAAVDESAEPAEADESAEPAEADESAPLDEPRAAAIPSRAPPAAAFEREEDASVLLLRTQQRDAWMARAEWLREEANALDDKAAQARGLLVVSELLAMSGEEAAAKSTAEEARALAPTQPLAHRQLRGLLSRESEWSAVLEVLDAEARAIPTPAARCHDALLAAEISRICLGDEEGAKKRLDQAMRYAPTDPRAHVRRFCEALGAPEPDAGMPSAASKVRFPEGAELGPLAEASAQVLAHRGQGKAGRPIGSSYEALLRVRSSIAADDHGAAVTGLEGLVRSERIAGGAGWLAAALAAPRKETRARSVEALRGVLDGSHPAAARRALAARAIELGDADAARAATSTAGSAAFSEADRIVLAALTDGSRSDIESSLDSVFNDAELAPIAAAASAAVGDIASPDRIPYPVGSMQSRTAESLGRTLASSESTGALSGAVASFADATSDGSLARALSLEIDLDLGNGGRVARAISAMREEGEGARERGLAGALIAEVAGEIDRAKAEYERLRSLDLADTATSRAAASHADEDGAARILAEHAQALEPSTAAAVLLAEAAAREAQTGDDSEADILQRRAIEIDPSLPFARHLGERAARARDDRAALLEWIRARREASEDPLEQAYDLVREALLVAEGDSTAAAPLLEQALKARPSDIGLRELFERLAPEPPPDRAAWRAERAAEAPPAEAARLALEAALELERAGDLESAARCAQQALKAGEDLLAADPRQPRRARGPRHGRPRRGPPPARPREQRSPRKAGDLRAHGRARRARPRRRRERLALAPRRPRRDAGSPAHPPPRGLVPRQRRPRRRARAHRLRDRPRPRGPRGRRPRHALRAPAPARRHLGRHPRARRDRLQERASRHLGVPADGRARPRQGRALARPRGDRQLIERTQRPSEAATLSLRAAQSALAANRLDDGRPSSATPSS
jgi:hypothetical protein